MSIRMSQIWMILLLCLLLMMAVFFWSAFNPAQAGQSWPVRWIEVSGSFERVSAEQVRSTAAPMLSHGFFAADLSAVRTQIETLPWVQRVEAKKIWPDKVSLTVYEHQPFARWGDKRLISESGNLFEVDSAYLSNGLPVFDGPSSRSVQMVAFYRELSELLEGRGMWLEKLHCSERGAWRLHLSAGLDVHMGSVEPLQRFERMLDSLDEINMDPLRQPVSVDLRYTNGFAVTWADRVSTELLAVNGESEEES